MTAAEAGGPTVSTWGCLCWGQGRGSSPATGGTGPWSLAVALSGLALSPSKCDLPFCVGDTAQKCHHSFCLPPTPPMPSPASVSSQLLQPCAPLSLRPVPAPVSGPAPGHLPGTCSPSSRCPEQPAAELALGAATGLGGDHGGAWSKDRCPGGASGGGGARLYTLTSRGGGRPGSLWSTGTRGRQGGSCGGAGEGGAGGNCPEL